MTLLRTLAATLTVAAALGSSPAAFSQSPTPGYPSITMTFEIEGDEGKVVGTVTAPSIDDGWQALPPDTKIDIVVTRSCYALGESGVEVATFTDLTPGESREFTDNATPAWQYGQTYTYNPVASIDGNQGNQGYGSMSPGISFSFAYNTVKADAKEKPDGGFEVEISALVPEKDNSQKPLTVDMTALEFYRVTDRSSWPNKTELMGTIENPAKGQTYTFTDPNPTENADNYYLVKCISKFGSTETSANTFVGYDVPASPYPVNAEAVEGGNKITWTAPDHGKNWGTINPDDTFYIVYRCWGRTDSEREQIAYGIKECEYTDYGTDMEFPRAVRYEVQAANSVGLGDSEYSGYYYELIVGPDESLPFIETFDGGVQHLWVFDYSSYYCQIYEAEEAEYGDGIKVQPHSGTGLVYADYTSSRGDATNDMTSYKIDVEGARCLALSYWYYAIPDTDISIDVQISKDGGEFDTVQTLNISENATESEWRNAFLPLGDLENVGNIVLQFHFSAPTSKAAAILDDIMLIDYKPVGNIEVEYDSEACSATLTWEDPSTQYAPVKSYEGFVDGQSVGTVELPWVFRAADYRKPQVLAVKAVYDHIEAPLSAPVTISVPRPPYTSFTIDDHTFDIVTSTMDTKEIVIRTYHGNDQLYKTPEMVTYDDVTYTVVGISTEAYKGNTSIISATIANDIAEIGESAFEGCSSLRAISFGSNLAEIKSAAFKGCSSLASVIFTSTSLPVVATDAFEGIKEGCKGTCPDGMAEDYAAVQGLAPIDFGVAGISGIEADDSDSTEYFDLQGRRVNNPVSGQMIIVRNNGKARVIVVK